MTMPAPKIRRILFILLILIVLIILSIKPLRKTSVLINLVFPPDDLYSVLDSTEIDLATEGGTYVLDFVNKYPGKHTIGVLVERPTPAARSYEMDFALDITVKRDREVLLTTSVNEPYMLFWGRERGSGIALFQYTVPEQLPMDLPLIAEATVIRRDPKFHGLYGNTSLYVKKMSDE
jgi:hypothetical protein